MTTKPTSELCRELRPGDRIRIAHVPREFSQPGYYVHKDTLRLYEHLVAERATLVVTHLDDLELPWIDYDEIAEDGTEVFHSLMINHDGLERVPGSGGEAAQDPS